MIYVDTSILLAEVLEEPRHPDDWFWQQRLVGSRLLEYEAWVRLHAYKVDAARTERARALIGRITLTELDPEVLARAMQPFPTGVRTLDGLHLATADWLRAQCDGTEVFFATFDARQRAAALALGLTIAPGF